MKKNFINVLLVNGILPVIICLLVSGLFLQCKSEDQDHQICKSDLRYLKMKYSVEAINSFYETCFGNEVTGAKDYLSKWKRDIFIYLDGNLWLKDSLYVNNVITEINALDLTVKLHLTKDALQANLPTFFGDYTYLKQKQKGGGDSGFVGMGIHTKSPITERANIGIANNSPFYIELNTLDSLRVRQYLMFNEIINILGPGADSWSLYNSMLFEGGYSTMHLSDLDKDILHLLYEPCVPAGYLRTNFEKDFKDILYHVDADKKLAKYVKKNRIPTKYLEFIKKYCFKDSTIVKYPKHVFVRLEGSYQKQDMEFCVKAINQLNTISQYLELELVQNDALKINPSLIIHYNEVMPGDSNTINGTFQHGGFIFQYRLHGVIYINWVKANNQKAQEKKNLILFNGICKMLGLSVTIFDLATVDSLGNIKLKSEYREILSLLYNPVIPNGFTIEEMNKVLK